MTLPSMKPAALSAPAATSMLKLPSSCTVVLKLRLLGVAALSLRVTVTVCPASMSPATPATLKPAATVLALSAA
ncbi:hypothetical protein D3C84_890450 [compost metagenome]